jgi:hypothetical protein
LYLNVSLDSDLVEGVLEESEVLYELVIVFGLPVDLVHRYLSGMHDVDDLAVNTPRPQLLYFC